MFRRKSGSVAPVQHRCRPAFLLAALATDPTKYRLRSPANHARRVRGHGCVDRRNRLLGCSAINHHASPVATEPNHFAGERHHLTVSGKSKLIIRCHLTGPSCHAGQRKAPADARLAHSQAHALSAAADVRFLHCETRPLDPTAGRSDDHGGR